MPKVTIYNPRGELEAEGEVPEGTSLLEASQTLGAHHGSAYVGQLIAEITGDVVTARQRAAFLVARLRGGVSRSAIAPIAVGTRR